MAMEIDPVWPTPQDCRHRDQGDFFQPTQTRYLMQLTLHGWFPRTTVQLMLPSVNHLHAAKPTLATAGAFGNMCSPQTVVIGPVIYL